MGMKIRALVMLVGLAVSGWANAAKYSVVLPVEASGLECKARAARVSVLFQSIPGVEKVDAVECVNEFSSDSSLGEYRVYSLAVDYTAKNSVNLASAVYGSDVNGFNSAAYFGAFATLDACLTARPAEVAAFEAQTGVSGLFLACLPDEGLYSDAFYLVIQGFGSAKTELVSTDFGLYFRKDEQLSSSQIQWLGTELAAMKANVRINDGRKLLYYAEYAIPAKLETVAWFQSSDQCTQQLADVSAIYGKASSKALVECQQGEGATRMLALALESRIGRTLPLSQKYVSFESCMKFKPAVEARELRNDPRRFLGLLCAPGSMGDGFVHWKLADW
jgi:hypothetical protein